LAWTSSERTWASHGTDGEGDRPTQWIDCVWQWLNVYERHDAITWPTPNIAQFYTRNGAELVQDVEVRPNRGPSGLRDPHHEFGYLSSQQVGQAVTEFLRGPVLMQHTPTTPGVPVGPYLTSPVLPTDDNGAVANV
jgi:hypothetical protein